MKVFICLCSYKISCVFFLKKVLASSAESYLTTAHCELFFSLASKFEVFIVAIGANQVCK